MQTFPNAMQRLGEAPGGMGVQPLKTLTGFFGLFRPSSPWLHTQITLFPGQLEIWIQTMPKRTSIEQAKAPDGGDSMIPLERSKKDPPLRKLSSKGGWYRRCG